MRQDISTSLHLSLEGARKAIEAQIAACEAQIADCDGHHLSPDILERRICDLKSSLNESFPSCASRCVLGRIRDRISERYM